jgi:hypothetical protein
MNSAGDNKCANSVPAYTLADLSKDTAETRISREIVRVSSVSRMGAFRASPCIVELRQSGIARPKRKANSEAMSHVVDP